jgi:hypothetical protein
MEDYALIGLNNYIFTHYIEPIKENKVLEQRYLDLVSGKTSYLTEKVAEKVISNLVNAIADDVTHELLKNCKR